MVKICEVCKTEIKTGDEEVLGIFEGLDNKHVHKGTCAEIFKEKLENIDDKSIGLNESMDDELSDYQILN